MVFWGKWQYALPSALLLVAVACQGNDPDDKRLVLGQKIAAEDSLPEGSDEPAVEAGSGTGPAIQVNPDNTTTTHVCDQADKLSPPRAGFGQLRLQLAEGTNPCTLQATLIGPATSPLKRASDGTPFFDDLPQGSYDLILTQTLGAGLQDEPTQRGVRLNGVVITAGNTNSATIPVLQPVANLSGTAQQSNTTSFANIQVKVLGTSYQTETAADGSWQLTNLPPGEHDLEFTATGYEKNRLTAQPVTTAADNTALPVTLSPLLDEGVTPQPLRLAGDGIEPDLDVTFFIYPDTPADEIRYGETSDLSAVPWQPFRTSVEVSLAVNEAIETTGTAVKTLYVELKKGTSITALDLDFEVDYFWDLRPVGAENVVKVVGLNADGIMPRPNFLVTTTLPAAAAEQKASHDSGAADVLLEMVMRLSRSLLRGEEVSISGSSITALCTSRR